MKILVKKITMTFALLIIAQGMTSCYTRITEEDWITIRFVNNSTEHNITWLQLGYMRRNNFHPVRIQPLEVKSNVGQFIQQFVTLPYRVFGFVSSDHAFDNPISAFDDPFVIVQLSSYISIDKGDSIVITIDKQNNVTVEKE